MPLEFRSYENIAARTYRPWYCQYSKYEKWKLSNCLLNIESSKSEYRAKLLSPIPRHAIESGKYDAATSVCADSAESDKCPSVNTTRTTGMLEDIAYFIANVIVGESSVPEV